MSSADKENIGKKTFVEQLELPYAASRNVKWYSTLKSNLTAFYEDKTTFSLWPSSPISSYLFMGNKNMSIWRPVHECLEWTYSK